MKLHEVNKLSAEIGERRPTKEDIEKILDAWDKVYLFCERIGKLLYPNSDNLFVSVDAYHHRIIYTHISDVDCVGGCNKKYGEEVFDFSLLWNCKKYVAEKTAWKMKRTTKNIMRYSDLIDCEPFTENDVRTFLDDWEKIRTHAKWVDSILYPEIIIPYSEIHIFKREVTLHAPFFDRTFPISILWDWKDTAVEKYKKRLNDY